MGQTRRTQAERKEETIARLLTAAADTIHELGYAGTTVQEICNRAGLSQGALFRHFPTRRAVLVATAMRHSENHVSVFAQRFGAVAPTLDSLVDALRLVRENARSPANHVWLELLGAARTDDELREELADAFAKMSANQVNAAEVFVAGDELVPGADLLSLLRITVLYFDAEADLAMIAPDPDRDEQDLQSLARLLVTQYPSVVEGIAP